VTTQQAIILAIVIDAVASACLSYSLAKKKGQDATAWSVCGFLFGILGLIAAAGLPTAPVVEGAEERKRCPDCAEMVGAEALVCPYCRHQFPAEEDEERSGDEQPAS
jgi:hypothetical protein